MLPVKYSLPFIHFSMGAYTFCFILENYHFSSTGNTKSSLQSQSGTSVKKDNDICNIQKLAVSSILKRHRSRGAAGLLLSGIEHGGCEDLLEDLG